MIYPSSFTRKHSKRFIYVQNPKIIIFEGISASDFTFNSPIIDELNVTVTFSLNNYTFLNVKPVIFLPSETKNSGF